MEQASRVRAKDAYTAYRIRMLPEQLESAYRKVEALQREARRLGMEDIIREIRS